jgi:putative transferase (TIGR04331 family)
MIYLDKYKKRPNVDDEVNNLALAERVINDVSLEMNALHGLALPTEYWMWLLMPHTQLFIEQIADRFQLQPEFSKNLNVETSSAKGVEIYDAHWSKAINIQIAIDINNYQMKSSIVNFKLSFFNKITINFKKFYYFFKNGLKVLRMVNYLKKYDGTNQIIFLDKILDIHFQAELENIFNAIHLNQEEYRPFIFSYKHRKDFDGFRYGSLKGSTNDDNDYVKFIYENFKKYLPVEYVELFSRIYAYYKNIECKILVCSCPVNVNQYYRHAFSAIKMNGARVLSFQHGGGYGISKYNSYEVMERNFSEKYVEWSGIGGEVVSSIFDLNNVELNKNKNIDLLIIGPLFKAYHRYNIGMHPFHNINVAERISKLILNLSNSPISIVYRPYKNHKDLVMNNIGNKYFMDSSIEDQISRSRYVVCTKPTTIINQCIQLNAYPILFWGEEYDTSDDANYLLSKLSEVGFYFNSVENCAERLNNLLRSDRNIFPDHSSVISIYEKLFGNGPSKFENIKKLIGDFDEELKL